MATTAAQQRNGRVRIERALIEEEDLRRGNGAREERPAPLQFDALGFPIPQPIPAFPQRVRRLIDGD